MSELYIGLIALGIVFVIGVYLYNKWQERRYRSLAEKVLEAKHADVLLDGTPDRGNAPQWGDDIIMPSKETQEPSLGETNEPEAVSSERIEPVISFGDELVLDEPVLDESLDESPVKSLAESYSAPYSESQAEISPAISDQERSDVSEPVLSEKYDKSESSDKRDLAEPVTFLSEQTDYIAALELIEPVRVAHLLQPVKDVLSRLHKPVLWVGYNESTRLWEVLDEESEQSYRSVRAGLQLVDRQGAIQESDLSAFHMVMQDLAAQMTAVINLPPRQPALDGAIRLDEFCASVDIQIGINVISQGSIFQGTKIRALAEAAGMLIDNQGRLVRRDDNDQELYALLNREIAGFTAENMKTMTTHGLTFLLDVPRVANGERVFDQMVVLAMRFAEVLRGQLVDDNRQVLIPATLEPIRKQVGYFQAMMQERGLPAGEPITIRLFS